MTTDEVVPQDKPVTATPSVSAGLCPPDCPWDAVLIIDRKSMGFRIIATEIVRQIDNRKWHETRDAIEIALSSAYNRGMQDAGK